MVNIIFIQHSGVERLITESPGLSLMEAAVRNGVQGIDADCGGACACATCHVFIDAAWFEKTGPQTTIEASMIDFAENVGATSRLACQVILSETLDGLIVDLPATQH